MTGGVQMEEQQQPGTAAEQPERVAAILGDIAERSRKLVEGFLARQQDLEPAAAAPGGEGARLGGTFVAMLARLMTTPHEWVQPHSQFWKDYARLWCTTTRRML